MAFTQQPSIISEIMKLILDHTTDGIFVIGNDGSILDANIALLNMLGWELEQLTDPMPAFIVNMTEEQHKALLDGLKKGRKYPYEIVKRKHKDGTLLDVLASYWPINKGDILAIGMYKDFTEQMDIHRKLEESERIYRTLVEHLPEAIIMQKNGKIKLINTATLSFFGAEKPEDVIGRSIWDFLSSENKQYIQRIIDTVYDQSDTGQLSIAVDKLQRHDGEQIYAEIKIIPVGSGAEPDIQIVFQDITAEKHYESQLEQLAYHDPLTGLKNRRIFKDVVTLTIESAQYLNENAIMYIDIDKFKHINDTYGHDVGDQLLLQFAERLQSCVRHGDVVSRIGGDEFLILLNNIHNKQDIIDISERILDLTQHNYNIEAHTLSITASIGITDFSGEDIDYRSLIQRADKALYEAKEQRNRFVFYTT